MSETSNKRESKKIYCNQCNGATNHSFLYRHSRIVGDPVEDQFYEEMDYTLWACAGCEAATLELRWEIPDAPEEFGGPEVTFYPKRTADHLKPKHFHKLSKNIGNLYREIIEAYNTGSMVLCTIGLRALLEAVCNDKKTPGVDLETKIDGLRAYLPSENLVNSIHGFRFSGNEAAHTLEALYPTEALRDIGVMEDLLNFLYDLDYKAGFIKNASKYAERKAAKVARTASSKPQKGETKLPN